MLNVEGLSCYYPVADKEVTAVCNLSFDLGKNSMLGLIGESGSGKTTVAWALLGMLGDLGGHAHGQFTWKGTVYDFHSPAPWRHLRWREIAIVPQTAMNSFNPVYTIGHSLTEVLKWHVSALGANERSARAKEILARVELDPQLFYSYPHQLSGGMRQRAALAKALICNPKILILDEATTGLDVITEGNILKTVAGLKKELGMSLIIITHDLRLVENLCDDYVVLKDGFAQQPGSPYIKKLFSAMLQIGKKPKVADVRGVPILVAKNMSKSFRKPGTRKKFLAIDCVSVSLTPGSITGLVGASGSGKSTLVNTLFHMLRPDGGSISFQGKTISSDPSAIKGMQRQMGLVRQDPFDSLPPHEKVSAVVAEPLQIHSLSEGRQKDLKKVSQLLAEVGLEPEVYIDRFPHQLSGGQRQRVAIARALVTNPSVLVLDEPTSMLDATIKLEILQLIAQQAIEKRLAVLLVTHDLAAASLVCDHILVLHHGKSVASGSFEMLLQNSSSSYLRQLLLAATDLKGYWRHLDEVAPGCSGEGVGVMIPPAVSLSVAERISNL
ncbi:MAG TPA: ABC transporter ATP-binding protein [Candidatus Limnocylindrales bacterium]|nr:ABC transporter ATP-binding protein [Candidatus Limnocylindrales bacterium]